jgi:hypothetical protein
VATRTETHSLEALALAPDLLLARSLSGPYMDETGSQEANAHGAGAAVRGTLTRCPQLRRGLAYYRSKIALYARKMGRASWHPGASARSGAHRGAARSFSCNWIRRAASLVRARAVQARRAYEKWSYQYAWWQWMPDKFQRIGACETGYGKRPGNFRWNSGTYQGFAGFWYGTWDAYKPRGAPREAFLATPREQYECALNVYAQHGYGAWGCGGA